ncbi:MAG: hypothetical protein K0R26_1996 [Bacteroidota bacterium]|jgi:RHS repeat-associated protein|nr:hypothetical protein [Bacteroidota bacterium]
MYERSFNTPEYKYGMNGQEKDDEIFQGAMTAEYWEYDSRLGRRWNPDPVVKSGQSPYACFNNNPIYFADPSGADGEPPIKKGQSVDLGNGQSYTSSADEVEVSACITCDGKTTGNPLAAATTYGGANVSPKMHNPSFDMWGVSVAGSGGTGLVGGTVSYKTYVWPQNPNNINTFKKDFVVTAMEIDIEGGAGEGLSGSVSYFDGTMIGVGQYSNQMDIIINSNSNFDVNASFNPVSIGGSFATDNKNQYTYGSIGLAYGGSVAYQNRMNSLFQGFPKVRLPLNKSTSKSIGLSLSNGVFRLIMSMPIPSTSDSVDFAKGKSDSISNNINKRNGAMRSFNPFKKQ